MVKEADLLYKINVVRKEIYPRVKAQLENFERINKQGSAHEWFHELCFCILTANTSSKMGSRIQDAVSAKEFLTLPTEKLCAKLHSLRCRFYNKRTEYIVLARKYKNIRNILQNKTTIHFQNNKERRLFIAEHIKGLNLKEASHFLRNVGYFDLAILDKHVLNVLNEYKLTKHHEEKRPKNEKEYETVERVLQRVAEKLSISQGELDYYIWYMKTGEVLK